MSDHPTCACPALDEIARLGLEGRDVPTCEIHRPDRTSEPSLNTALNSAELTRALGEPLHF